jgi:hypothetical protein
MIVNRRSFIQLMAAAFATATTGKAFPGWSAAKRPAIRYELFTDMESIRYSIGSPFVIDGSCYATDAKILIQTADELAGHSDDAKLPNVAMLPWDAMDSIGWKRLKWSSECDMEVGRCEHCLGTGRVGDGVRKVTQQIYKYAQEFWIGGEGCPACGRSSGGKPFPTVGTFNGQRFDAAYLARIKTLGDIEAKVIQWGCKDELIFNQPLLLFRADGVKGMACGLTR